MASSRSWLQPAPPNYRAWNLGIQKFYTATMMIIMLM